MGCLDWSAASSSSSFRAMYKSCLRKRKGKKTCWLTPVSSPRCNTEMKREFASPPLSPTYNTPSSKQIQAPSVHLKKNSLLWSLDNCFWIYLACLIFLSPFLIWSDYFDKSSSQFESYVMAFFHLFAKKLATAAFYNEDPSQRNHWAQQKTPI